MYAPLPTHACTHPHTHPHTHTQVLKAITSGPETETQLAQPTQDVSKTPTGDKPAGSDEAPTVTPPLTEPELTTPSLEPAAAEPGAETTLKKLIEEVKKLHGIV